MKADTVDYEFEVITDAGEIERLNTRLGMHLKSVFRYKHRREITYPVGHSLRTVYFESDSGEQIRAWSPHSEGNKHVNFLLSGDPSSEAWMPIEVQLNFPAGTYNRMMAGAFVKDRAGDVFVAHRGKLTKGRAGLKKDDVFSEFASRTISAKDIKHETRLILISALEAADLPKRLWDFAEEAREIATRISARQVESTTTVKSHKKNKKSSPPPLSNKEAVTKGWMLKLRGYFEEYAGSGQSKGHGGGKRTVEHGDIVRALEAQLRSKGLSKKAQAIDLAIVTEVVDLYEVKTSARTTDVYTGVGQLIIHGECIRELLNLPVRRHLVLPTRPHTRHQKPITKKADISIITFKKTGANYRFSGLP